MNDRFERHRQPWTSDELQKLHRLAGKGLSLKAMAKALTAAGNPPEGMIIKEGEEHGYYKEENNLELYTRMLEFFGRHIGGGRSAAR